MEDLESRLKDDYGLGNRSAKILSGLSRKLKGRSKFMKWAFVVASPIKNGLGKTQSLAYDILGLGPKGKEYMMSVIGALDVSVPLSCYIVDYFGKHPPAYLEGIVSYANSVVEKMPYLDWTKDHLALVGTMFVLESVVVSALALYKKKPYPRFSSVMFFNPFLLGGIGNKVKNYVSHSIGKKINEFIPLDIDYTGFDPFGYGLKEGVEKLK